MTTSGTVPIIDLEAIKKRLQFCNVGHRLAIDPDIEALIAHVDRLERQLAEATEQLRRQGEVVEAARNLGLTLDTADCSVYWDDDEAIALHDALVRLDASDSESG